MSHYEKIAVVIIRAAGCCTAVYALLSAAYCVLIALPTSVESAVAAMFPGIFYLIVGVALFALSRPLATRIVQGIGNE